MAILFGTVYGVVMRLRHVWGRQLSEYSLVFVLLVLTTLPAAAGKVYPAWVIPDTLNVRSGPGADRKKIGTLSKGTKVLVTAFRNKWCWAKLPDGSWGWVAEWLLQFSAAKGRALAKQAAGSATTSSPPPAWVNASNVNVRKGPGLQYESYGKLRCGTKVYILEKHGSWFKCRTPGGRGWIRGDLLEFDVQKGRKLAQACGGTAKAYIAEDNVRLREGPGTNYDIIAILKKGQTIYVTQRHNDWVKATVHGGRTGWVAKWLIKYEGGDSAARAVAISPPGQEFPSPVRSGSNDERNELRGLAAWIGVDRVNVRYGPSLEHQVKCQLSKGTKVHILDLQGHWLKVKYKDDADGWIAGWCLNFTPPGTPVPVAKENGHDVEVRVGWVAREEVNVRTGPGTNYPEIGELTLSTQIVIIGQQGEWYKVAMDNGKVGWVASWLVDTRAQRRVRRTPAEEVAAARQAARLSLSHGGSEMGSKIVNTAMSKLGAPYRRGSAGPNAFDCSGFVYWVHKQHGITLTRSSAEMIKCGKPVPSDKLQPGDVVYFENTYRRGISHVGIYIGNGEFVHAANHRKGVVVGSLSSSYYAPRYVGAHRMY